MIPILNLWAPQEMWIRREIIFSIFKRSTELQLLKISSVNWLGNSWESSTWCSTVEDQKTHLSHPLKIMQVISPQSLDTASPNSTRIQPFSHGNSSPKTGTLNGHLHLNLDVLGGTWTMDDLRVTRKQDMQKRCLLFLSNNRRSWILLVVLSMFCIIVCISWMY